VEVGYGHAASGSHPVQIPGAGLASSSFRSALRDPS
jgi:hypothetical protein